VTTSIDRTAWPWRSAPDDVTDYDEAAWYTVRATRERQLPRKDLETWILEQRARRSRDVLEPEPKRHGSSHPDWLSGVTRYCCQLASAARKPIGMPVNRIDKVARYVLISVT
jgi:hypothetical protein